MRFADPWLLLLLAVPAALAVRLFLHRCMRELQGPARLRTHKEVCDVAAAPRGRDPEAGFLQ